MAGRRGSHEAWADHLAKSAHCRIASETPSGRDVRLPITGRQMRAGRKSQRLEGLPLLIWQLQTAGAEQPETEFMFHEERLWAADLAWPKHWLIFEYEGGVYTGGRHTRGKGFEGDIVKYNAATLLGFRVLRGTYGSVESGEALSIIMQALEQPSPAGSAGPIRGHSRAVKLPSSSSQGRSRARPVAPVGDSTT